MLAYQLDLFPHLLAVSIEPPRPPDTVQPSITLDERSFELEYLLRTRVPHGFLVYNLACLFLVMINNEECGYIFWVSKHGSSPEVRGVFPLLLTSSKYYSFSFELYGFLALSQPGEHRSFASPGCP